MLNQKMLSINHPKLINLVREICKTMLYVRMYVINDQERTDCSKRPYWSENRLKSKNYG